ncbi:hypothetical protein ACFC0C_16235 [Streptomyces sp. NPDC056178]|uniref:hypothetical protein n=1 Tax=unclassified Streptomyces TaxID=2593676 RepID=UPI0035DD98E2
MFPAQPDFRLKGFEAADERVAEAFWQHIEIEQSDLTVLAEHHAPDGQHSHYVLHNGAVTWGIPGEPQIVALHLQRETTSRTFRFEHATLPLPAMAQSWLIARDCPKDAIRLPPELGTTAADKATAALEERLMSDGDHFALLHSYTADTAKVPQILVLLRALDESAVLPFRILLEEADLSLGTHTLREGGFSTLEAATAWWDGWTVGQEVPLPVATQGTRRITAPVAPASSPPVIQHPRLGR